MPIKKLLHLHPRSLCNEYLLYHILNLYRSWRNWIWRLNQCNAVMWRNTFILLQSIYTKWGLNLNGIVYTHTHSRGNLGCSSFEKWDIRISKTKSKQTSTPHRRTILAFTFFPRINLKWPSRNVFVNKPLWGLFTVDILWITFRLSPLTLLTANTICTEIFWF